MTQSFQTIKDGKNLKEVKILSSFKGSMRTTLKIKTKIKNPQKFLSEGF